MRRNERNRRIFASAISGSSGFTTSSTSRGTRPGTEPTEPIVVEEEERETTRPETSN